MTRKGRLTRVIILNILTRTTMMVRLTLLTWNARVGLGGVGWVGGVVCVWGGKVNITPVRATRKRGEGAGRSK